MESLGVYIQVPFCASKCSFCNFTSRVAPQDVYDSYCDALGKEIDLLPQFYQSAQFDLSLFAAPVDTLYFGGGTPSLLGIERLSKIISNLRRRFNFAENLEFTLELTPGSADSEFLDQTRALGLNRLSIGAQSFADSELRSVGRLHSANDTMELVRAARSQGITNISLDLIAGLPHQTEQSWQMSLSSAIRLQPEHISIYLFEIDEKSRLGGEVLRHGSRYHAEFVPDEDFMAGAYEQACETLRREGYDQYEISNFSRPGRESIHNLKYWERKPYVGLGAGAHSFNGQSRWLNAPDVEAYKARLALSEPPIQEQHELSPAEQIEEFFFLGLRQRKGIELADAWNRWGHEPLAPWTWKIEELESDGWIERAGHRVWLAERALLVSNEIFQEFIAA